MALLWKKLLSRRPWDEGRSVVGVWSLSAGSGLWVMETFLTAAFECHLHLAVPALLPPGAQSSQQECFNLCRFCCFLKKSKTFLFQLSGWKELLVSIIAFTWRLLPALLYWSGTESGLRVNDTLRDRALPEKLLAWLSLNSCCSGALSLAIISLPLQ